MKIIRTVKDLRRKVSLARKSGKKIGLVPTMGALHNGHGALVRQSVRAGNFTVVSIFVNPLQFGPGEDLDRYPRRLPMDAQLVAEAGGDVVFAPSVEEMYPFGTSNTLVVNEALENLYCGSYRPGHFRGVLTVVAKLFQQCQPDRVYFGQKDYQQLFLIRRMVQDLDMPIKVVGVPTVREKDGLAMSSRNEYLSTKDRQGALAIWRTLQSLKASYANGERKIDKMRKMATFHIQEVGGKLQYIEFADKFTLEPREGRLDGAVVVLLAAFFGKTRLIDNCEL